MSRASCIPASTPTHLLERRDGIAQLQRPVPPLRYRILRIGLLMMCLLVMSLLMVYLLTVCMLMVCMLRLLLALVCLLLQVHVVRALPHDVQQLVYGIKILLDEGVVPNAVEVVDAQERPAVNKQLKAVWVGLVGLLFCRKKLREWFMMLWKSSTHRNGLQQSRRCVDWLGGFAVCMSGMIALLPASLWWQRHAWVQRFNRTRNLLGA